MQLVEKPPASTFMQVNSLEKPEFPVEIDSIGIVSRERPDWANFDRNSTKSQMLTG
jgi:hypothetical protein